MWHGWPAAMRAGPTIQMARIRISRLRTIRFRTDYRKRGLSAPTSDATSTAAWARTLRSSDGLLLLGEAVGQDDVDDRRDGFGAGPVALQLAGERDPADRLAAGQADPLQAGPVGLGRGAGDRVDDRVDLGPVVQRVERGEGHADLGPQRADDQLTAAGGADGRQELDVLPGVG